MPLFYRRLEGRAGYVEIPYLGSRVGELTSWTATRRADEGPEAEFYNLHAVLGWVAEALFNDTDYEKRVVVNYRNGPEHEVIPVEGPGQRTVLKGRSLILERVRLQIVRKGSQ